MGAKTFYGNSFERIPKHLIPMSKLKLKLYYVAVYKVITVVGNFAVCILITMRASLSTGQSPKIPVCF